MIKSIFLLSCLLLVGCSTKAPKIKAPKHNAVMPVSKPKHKLILPYSKDIYSTHKYARFMYDLSCTDLEFRLDDLYKNEMRYDPLSVLEVTKILESEIKKRGCKY